MRILLILMPVCLLFLHMVDGEEFNQEAWESINQSIQRAEDKLFKTKNWKVDQSKPAAFLALKALDWMSLQKRVLCLTNEAIADKTQVRKEELDFFVDGILRKDMWSIRRYEEIITALAALEYER